jgi:hypothetical protein
MANSEQAARRRTPLWAIPLIIAIPAFGVAAIVRGDLVTGVIWVAAVPAAFVVGRLIGRGGVPPPDADGPDGVAHTLKLWAVGLGTVSAFFVVLGVVVSRRGDPSAVPALVLAIAGLWLAARALQSLLTVRRLTSIAERHGLGELVVLIAREPGARGFARRGVVIGLNETRLAIARSRFRNVSWEIMSLAELSKADVRVTGPGGDLENRERQLRSSPDGDSGTPVATSGRVAGGRPGLGPPVAGSGLEAPAPGAHGLSRRRATPLPGAASERPSRKVGLSCSCAVRLVASDCGPAAAGTGCDGARRGVCACGRRSVLRSWDTTRPRSGLRAPTLAFGASLGMVGMS